MHNLPTRGIGLTGTYALLATFGYGISPYGPPRGMWPPKRARTERVLERRKVRLPKTVKLPAMSAPAPRSAAETKAIEAALGRLTEQPDPRLEERLESVERDFRQVSRELEREFAEDEEEALMITLIGKT